MLKLMKIKKAKISIDKIFQDLEIEFMSKDHTTIHYLVGENGNGKTKILEALHSSITKNNLINKFSVSLNCQIPSSINVTNAKNNEILHSFNKNGISSSNESYYLDDQGRKHAAAFNELKKSVYSSVEVNYSNYDVKSITATTTDSFTPNEVSKNLNSIIPQLLVDIKQQDAVSTENWAKTKGKKADPYPDTEEEWEKAIPELKFTRFKRAYNEIFDNKQFHEIRTQRSYQIIFKDSKGNEVDINDFSSGEKQIIYRLGYLLKNLETLDEGSIFIDEPEISLHPKWQTKFKKLLLDIFKDSNTQIIIATHSPYIFQDLNPVREECILVDRAKNKATQVELILSGQAKSPSMSLVGYKAYGLTSEALHIELYSFLQAKCSNEVHNGDDIKIFELENWLVNQKGYTKNKTHRSASKKETIHTWIRNKIHHADNADRLDYRETDLKESIDKMLEILKN